MSLPSRQSGFVLLNALVLVAALAAVAVLLLAKAEGGRARLSQSRAAAQLAMNLDAFEAYAVHVLESSADGGPDHLARAWAAPIDDMPLERGATAGRILDQQGLFNVNWLTDPDNIPAQAAFDRLAQGLGVPAREVEALRSLLRPGGPADKGPFRRLDPPEDPVGGALLMIRQLERMPSLSPTALQLILPYVTALPGNSKLNPNTAHPYVLAAFLPDLPPAALDTLLARRREKPFVSAEDFLQNAGLLRVEEDAGSEGADPQVSEGEDEAEDPEALSAGQLGVQSEWFLAEIKATLEGRQARREVLLLRTGQPALVRAQWRVTTRP